MSEWGCGCLYAGRNWHACLFASDIVLRPSFDRNSHDVNLSVVR